MRFHSTKTKMSLTAFDVTTDLYFAVDARGIVRGSCNQAALQALQHQTSLLPPGGIKRLETLADSTDKNFVGRLGDKQAVWQATRLSRTTVLVRCSTELGQHYHDANVDPLTGLANKRQFIEDLSEYRSATGLTALLFIDIDHFKQFNDTFGHQAGDELLRKVGSVIGNHLRPEDKSYRYGGEEFAYRMRGLIDNHAFTEAVVRSRADAIRREVSQIRLDGIAHSAVTISIGVVIYSSSVGDDRQFTEQADHALYYAKETGRNRIVFYDEVPVAWLEQRLAAVSRA